MAKTDKLARREREILRLAVEGLAPKQIAAELELDVGTVHRRLVGIAIKVGVQSRQEVLNWALQNPTAIKQDVRSEPPIERGLHPAGCPCASPFCQARRLITAA